MLGGRAFGLAAIFRAAATPFAIRVLGCTELKTDLRVRDKGGNGWVGSGGKISE
jgi:hypothetical protein